MNKTQKAIANLKPKPLNDMVKDLSGTASIYGIYSLFAKKYLYIGQSSNTRKSCQDWISRISREGERYKRLNGNDYEFRIVDPTIKLLNASQRNLLQLDYINVHKTWVYPGYNKINPVTGKKFR